MRWFMPPYLRLIDLRRQSWRGCVGQKVLNSQTSTGNQQGVTAKAMQQPQKELFESPLRRVAASDP
jgi:hypothetical protein